MRRAPATDRRTAVRSVPKRGRRWRQTGPGCSRNLACGPYRTAVSAKRRPEPAVRAPPRLIQDRSGLLSPQRQIGIERGSDRPRRWRHSPTFPIWDGRSETASVWFCSGLYHRRPVIPGVVRIRTGPAGRRRGRLAPSPSASTGSIDALGRRMTGRPMSRIVLIASGGVRPDALRGLAVHATGTCW